MEEEILLIDKPKGITSFDCIRILRKKCGILKMGHAGTLDPLASGLMIIGVGAGTKKLSEYIKLPKAYETEILIGEKRSTGDMEGEMLEEKHPESLSEAEVRVVLESIEGILELPVPIYSAIKQKGQALYKKARAGEVVEPPIKKMIIDTATFTSLKKEGKKYILDVIFEVQSGVYIRSVAEEVGRRLGYPACVKELRRIRVGDFNIKDAKKLEDF